MNPVILSVKITNKRNILEYLINNGETSRITLASALGLSTGTVTNIVTELIQEELVYESRQENSAAGRKTTLLRFNEKKALVLTCIMNGTIEDSIDLAVQDLLGNVISNETIPCMLHVNTEHTEIILIKEIIEYLQSFINRQPENVRKLLCAIGLCIGGMVDSNQLIYAPIFNWQHLNFVTPLSAALHLPVHAEGITRIRALYELRWLDGSEKNVIYLNLSTGIGMVNFFNGKMIRGKTGISGEVGHISLNPFGPKCYCGNNGCFEYYCGMTQMLERVRASLDSIDENDVLYDLVVRKHKPLNPSLVFEAWEKGSLVMYQLLSSVSKYLGAGLTTIYNIYDPDHIVLSGYIDGLDGPIIEDAIIDAKSKIINKFSRQLNITRAHLKPEQENLATALFVTSKYLDSIIE
ncbi:MAG: ROK family transcriptional regulator [Lachnospiraceae bacterium]|nr:ROK family transcriptional regulator [Lachnospiraceae bacterium]